MAVIERAPPFLLPPENKCGELSFSTQLQEITLHCIFCGASCKKLESFLNHLQKEHIQEVDSEQENIKVEEKHEVEQLEADAENEIFPSENVAIKAESKNEVHDAENEDKKPLDVQNDPLSLEQDNELEITGDVQQVDEIEGSEKMHSSTDAMQFKSEPDIEYELDASNCSFLDSDMEIYQLSEEDNNEGNENNSATSAKRKNKEIVFELIKELEEMPNMWDNAHEDFHKLSVRVNSVDKMTETLQNRFPHEYICKDYVQNKIRELFNIFHKTELGNPPAGSKTYYERLNFLRGHLMARLKLEKNAKGLYNCPICKKEFHNRSYLSDHVRRHRKEYSYRCEVCTRPFYRPTELRKHMLLHTNEKPYVCEICGRDFRLLNKLQRHRKHHLQQRDFKCTLCPKAYFRKEVLTAHMKTHSTERSETCEVCGKSFHNKHNLKQHIKLHNPVKAYACSICNKAFAQPAGRSAHMRTHRTEIHQ